MKAFHEVRNYRSDFMVWQCAYTNISFLAHWHQEIELVYLRSGSARFCINEHNFTARTGDLVLIDTGDAKRQELGVGVLAGGADSYIAEDRVHSLTVSLPTDSGDTRHAV